MKILRDISGLACALTLLVFAFGFVGNYDYADALVTDAIRKELRVQRALGMPPADPIFEQRIDLLRMSIPVTCVRPSGIENVGQEWIRQWGDGDRPPLVPDCVKASAEGTL